MRSHSWGNAIQISIRKKEAFDGDRLWKTPHVASGSGQESNASNQERLAMTQIDLGRRIARLEELLRMVLQLTDSGGHDGTSEFSRERLGGLGDMRETPVEQFIRAFGYHPDESRKRYKALMELNKWMEEEIKIMQELLDRSPLRRIEPGQ